MDESLGHYRELTKNLELAKEELMRWDALGKLLVQEFLDPATLNCVMDMDGNMWLTTRLWHELTGLDAVELKNTKFYDLMPPEFGKEAKAMWDSRNENYDLPELPDEIPNVYWNPKTEERFYPLWGNYSAVLDNRFLKYRVKRLSYGEYLVARKQFEIKMKELNQ